MKTTVSLANINIAGYLGLETEPEGFDSVRFEHVCVHPELQTWEIAVQGTGPEALACLTELRELLTARFKDSGLRIHIRPRYTGDIGLDEYLAEHWCDICFEISCQNPYLLSFLDPCSWSVLADTVTISVVSDLAVNTLRDRGCSALIQQRILHDTSQQVSIAFGIGNFETEINQNLQKRHEAVREKTLVSVKASVEEQKKVVFHAGKAVPHPPVSIHQLLADLPGRKTVTIEGRVVAFNPASGDFRRIDRFALTDYTSTIECFPRVARRYPDGNNNEPPPTLAIAVNDWLSVTGTLDKGFNDEIQLKADHIERIDSRIPSESGPDHRVELHAHTKMSAMDGLTNVADMIERAAYWQHSAIGITDHGNVHVFPEAYALGKKHGIKVLLGMEGYLANHDSGYIADKVEQKDQGRGFSRQEMAEFKQNVHHIILYVRTLQGLRNLYDLVSLSHTRYFYNKPLIPRDELLAHREGLVVGSACECGEIYQLALDEFLKRISPDEFIPRFEQAAALYDYFEIQPLANNAFYISKSILASEQDLQQINRRVYELGKQYHKPVVATGDVHVLEEQDSLFRRILQAGQGFDNDNDECDTALYLKTTKQMLEDFSYLGEEIAREIVIDNPVQIAASIDTIAPIPDGFHPPTLDGSEQELKHLCYTRAKELYGEKLHPVVITRLERELHDIIGNRFADLYMLAQKVVRKSMDDGYIVGSRGSVGSSFVAYLSGITEVNSLSPHYACPQCSFTEFVHYDDTGEARAEPLDGIQAEVGVDLPPRKCPLCSAKMDRYGFDIPFETFVGFKGDKTPDIDLNFASEYQPRAHRYVEELFGKEYVYRAGTISTLQDRTAYGFVKKYLEQIGTDWPRAEIDRIVQGLTGIKRTTGQHPGGMIILPKDKAITEFCPVQYPANKSSAPNMTTHFDYHAMEDQLLKLDILGHDDPTQIRLLSDYLGFDVTTVPLDDRKMLSIFSDVKSLGVAAEQINTKVGTYGIPEFGTEFVRSMLVDTRPKKFADLIRISGLSHGTDVWLNNARDLIKNKMATLKEVICTRDDIMHDLILKGVDPFAAFKIMEKVRKGKGLTPEDEALMRDHKVPEWYIQSCQKIKYMFPKAHAVAYVLNAARIAYCKVHHPLEFYATYFTVMRHKFNAMIAAGGSKLIRNAITELQRKDRRAMTANDQATLVVLEVALEMSERGVVMKPIDIYASEASSCVITDNAIIPPFTAFPGLGDSVAESIIAARKEGPFSSREDFQRRTLCNRTLLENMTEAGLLSSMPASDQLDMWEMAAAPAIHPESPAPATETKPEQEPVLSDQSNQSDESDKPGMQDDAGSVDFFAVDEAPVADEKPAIDETRAESAKPSAPKKPARVRDTQPDLGMELF